MVAVYHFLSALVSTLLFVLNIYKYIVIFAALISWVNPDPLNPIVRFLFSTTAPVYRRMRRLYPRALLTLPFDISPIILLILLFFLSSLLASFSFTLQNHILGLR